MTMPQDDQDLELHQNEFTQSLNSMVTHLAGGGTAYAQGCTVEGMSPESDGQEIYLIGVNRDKLPFAARNAFDNFLSGLSEFDRSQQGEGQA